MQLKSFFAELKERRVIRAAVIYAALLWALLQVADVMAGAGIIDEGLVRVLITVGIIGFPLTIIGSWFVESPWKDRKGAALAGDVAIIAGIAVAAFLIAWQQWMQSFSRPVVAVLAIEATDTREDTAMLAEHLSRRLRAALATRPELKVIESDSSLHTAVRDLPVVAKAELLGVERLISGTLSRGGDDLRLSLQLFDANGELLWGDRFEHRLVDQVQLQSRVVEKLGLALGIEEISRADIVASIEACGYPRDEAAIMALANRVQTDLVPFIEANEADGLLYIAQARRQFEQLASLPPPQRPVTQQLAMQNLDNAESVCPGNAEIGLLRLENTLVFRDGGVDASATIADYPNASVLYYWLADAYFEIDADDTAVELVAEAVALSPASRTMLCRHRNLLESNDGDVPALLQRRISVFVPGGCAD